jgi:hypothetical protein
MHVRDAVALAAEEVLVEEEVCNARCALPDREDIVEIDLVVFAYDHTGLRG